MKILIVFATRFGTTETCTALLAESLKEKSNEVEVINLKKFKKIDPKNYDVVVIGGSFLMFRMNSSVKRFVKNNLDTLLNKKTAVFMCGADENWEDEIKKGFPRVLLEKVIAKGYFGYELKWDKMNPIFRKMMQKGFKTTEPVSKIYTENIKKFAEEITKT